MVARCAFDEEDKILYKSSSLTDSNSVVRNLNKICMKSISYPLRVIKKLYVFKDMSFQNLVCYSEDSLEFDIDKKLILQKMIKHLLLCIKIG